MKKLNQKGFSHHLMIVGIAVLVVSAVGFAGFRVYKGRNIEASANSYKWTDLSTKKSGCNVSSVTICVCRESLSTKSWKIRAKAFNRGLNSMGWGVDYGGTTIMSGTVSAGTTPKPGRASSVHYKTVAKNPSAIVSGGLGWGQRGVGFDGISINSVANCF